MKRIIAIIVLGFSFAAFADDAPPADAKADKGAKKTKAKKGDKAAPAKGDDAKKPEGGGDAK
jgi:hypothetical protein